MADGLMAAVGRLEHFIEPRPIIPALCTGNLLLCPSQDVLRAQEVDKPAIPPQPRTINLTQGQCFIIKENEKDLDSSKAPMDAPETIGDGVPQSVELHALPPDVASKVPQARSDSFLIQEWCHRARQSERSPGR
jgi:hypothetical protein